MEAAAEMASGFCIFSSSFVVFHLHHYAVGIVSFVVFAVGASIVKPVMENMVLCRYKGTYSMRDKPRHMA